MSLLRVCTKYLCLELSEDVSALILKSIYGDNNIVIDVNSVDEVVEVLEELAEIAKSFAQYLRELRYVKGLDLEFPASD